MDVSDASVVADYPASFKLAAVWLARQPDACAEQVARELEIDPVLLMQWQRDLNRAA